MIRVNWGHAAVVTVGGLICSYATWKTWPGSGWYFLAGVPWSIFCALCGVVCVNESSGRAA